MALGSLLIQKQYHYPDEELVEQIRENPYYQYFIGLSGYEDKIPFVPSLLVEFRKRLSEDVLNEINEMIIAYNTQQNDDDSDGGSGDAGQSDQQDSATDSENAGTLILDATCAQQNIKYPQDIELLNEAREKLEDMICRISEKYGFYRPRMYRQKARKDYLALGRPKKDADSKAEKKIAYMDNTDRIEVERKFSLAKRKFGLGLLLTKREDTTKSSIVLSIIAMNIDRLAAMFLRFIRFLLNFTLSYGRLVCF